MSIYGFCDNKCKYEVFTKDEIRELLLSTKPIGSIEINTTGENPSTYIGGTWEAWGSGRVPVGIDDSQEEFATVEKTGGEKEHTLTISEMAKHQHAISYPNAEGTFSAAIAQVAAADTKNSFAIEMVLTQKTGENQPHNNLQPYITCYMWKRTA